METSIDERARTYRNRSFAAVVEDATRTARLWEKGMTLVRNRLSGEYCFFGSHLWPQALEPDVADWELVGEVTAAGALKLYEVA